MSPEYRKTLYINQRFDYEKCDIFSIGLIIMRLEI